MRESKRFQTWFNVLGIALAVALFSIPSLSEASPLEKAPSLISKPHLGQIQKPRFANPLRLHIPAYGWLYSDEDLRTMAERFHFVIGLNDSWVSQIKSLKPELPMTYYTTPILVFENDPDWRTIDAHEDWFLHDSSGVARIWYQPWGGWLMDPQSVGSGSWSEFYANRILAKVTSSDYDGAFGDLTFEQLYPSDFSPAPPQDRVTSWNSDMTQFLSDVKKQIGSALFVVNTFDLHNFYQVTDGIMLEQFCHAPWQSHSQYFSVGEWKDQMDALQEISASGKWFLAQSGVAYQGLPYPDEEKMREFCLGSYLLGKESDFGTYYFVRDDSNVGCGSTGCDGYFGVFYYPEYGALTLGAPLDRYVEKESTQVFERRFENGLVLVNPTPQTKTVTLDEEMETLDGNHTTFVNLLHHSAEILKDVPTG